MDLAERNRLIAMTRGFNNLCGLANAPMGLALCGWILLDWLQLGSMVRDSAKALVLLIGLAATLLARRYYRRHLGVVRPKPGASAIRLLLVITAFALQWGADWLDVKSPYSISLVPLWWAAFYVLCYVAPYRIRTHSLYFAALFVILALLPATGYVSQEQFFLGRSNVGSFVIWFSFSVHGLMDHQLLMRLMRLRAQPVEQHA